MKNDSVAVAFLLGLFAQEHCQIMAPQKKPKYNLRFGVRCKQLILTAVNMMITQNL